MCMCRVEVNILPYFGFDRRIILKGYVVRRGLTFD